MNIFLILIIVISSFQHDGIAQKPIMDGFTYKATYELIYQPDSTDIGSKKNEEMVLYIGKGISRFSSAGKAISDSLESNQSNNNSTNSVRMRNQSHETAFEYYIYKGIPPGKITYTQEIIRDKYRYIEDKRLFDWKILNETDTISGLVVQKATTSFAGRDYTAWFTEEFPIPEGPYKFNGLPGLIVEIGDTKGHYVFKLKEIKKLDEPIPLTFQEEEFIKTTQKKLLELEEDYRRDPVGYTKRAMPGLNIKIRYKSEEHKNRLERERKENFKKQNNPIELQ